jgi:hypothetical protein
MKSVSNHPNDKPRFLFIICMAAFLLCLCFYCKKSKAQDFIGRQIKNKIDFPKELKTGNFKEDVTIHFSIEEHGIINLSSIECDNEYLKTYVEIQLAYIRLRNTYPSCEKLFSLNLTFKEY